MIDKCNLRCTYCMPVEGFEWIPKSEILRYEEIRSIVRADVGNGSAPRPHYGGEPLVRQDLPELVTQLRTIPTSRTLHFRRMRFSFRGLHPNCASREWIE